MARYEYHKPRSIKEAIDLMKKVMGATHPDTLITMTNLAITYMQMEEYEKAYELYYDLFLQYLHKHGLAEVPQGS